MYTEKKSANESKGIQQKLNAAFGTIFRFWKCFKKFYIYFSLEQDRVKRFKKPFAHVQKMLFDFIGIEKNIHLVTEFLLKTEITV